MLIWLYGQSSSVAVVQRQSYDDGGRGYGSRTSSMFLSEWVRRVAPSMFHIIRQKTQRLLSNTCTL